jgi:hypothetical protein
MPKPYYRQHYGKQRLDTIHRVRINLNRFIRDAQKICASKPKSAECKVAWSTVEELSETLYILKQKNPTIQDILCDIDPDDPECKVFD